MSTTPGPGCWGCSRPRSVWARSWSRRCCRRGTASIARSALVRWGLPTYAVAVIAFGLAPNWPLGLAALLVVGGGFLVVIATTNTAVQMIVADEMRGRVMSVRVMGFTLAFPVGSLAQGALGDWWGPQLTVVIFGCDPSLRRRVVVDQADAARPSRRSRRHPRPITHPRAILAWWTGSSCCCGRRARQSPRCRRNQPSVSRSTAVWWPHAVPSPSPPYANDTVMQCMVDTLYMNADMGSSMLSASSLDDFGSTHRYVPPGRSMR